MAEGEDFPEDELTPEEKQQASKWNRLGTLITAAIFVLGIVLPPKYRVFVPFLFLIPLVLALVLKARQRRKKDEYSPYVPGQNHTVEPYSHTPKDPNDPRRYKPIG